MLRTLAIILCDMGKNRKKFENLNIIDLKMPLSEFTSTRKLKFSMFKKLWGKGEVNE